MKTKLFQLIPLIIATLFTVPHTHAQSTAFTYQGALSDENGPANGQFDMTFGLFTTDTGGTAVSTETNTSVSVVDGLFTTSLDYGAAVFDGTDYWLEIGVQPDGGGGFSTLSPRQALNPVPYAIHARMAMDVMSGTVKDLTFFGTTFAPMDVFANSMRVLRLDGLSFLSPNIIAGSEFNTVADGVSGASIGGGGGFPNLEALDPQPNVITSDFGTICGGLGNTNQGYAAAIAGGQFNNVQGHWSNISGGKRNAIHSSVMSSIGGGGSNNVQVGADYCSIGGGLLNSIASSSVLDTDASVISGGEQNGILRGADHSVIGGGLGNTNHSFRSVIGGGFKNFIDSDMRGSVISGGWGNEVGTGFGNSYVLYGPPSSGTIGGGEWNQIGNASQGCTIAGGEENAILPLSVCSTIGGGFKNSIGDGDVNEFATIGGGYRNTNNSSYATISGGVYNTTEGVGATISGGAYNTAVGSYSFAAGRNAGALHDGSFIWADSSATTNTTGHVEGIAFPSIAINEFAVRATGGVRFVTGIDTNGTPTAGATLSPGSGSWSMLSDRNAKEQFQTVDTKTVLEQVVALPMQSWKYKAQRTGIRHIGPMAQDFYAAFNVGEDERRINTVDADGVALAAIQGLNQKLVEKEAEIESLKQRMAVLEKWVQQSLRE